MSKKALLMILDGWGVRRPKETNDVIIQHSHSLLGLSDEYIPSFPASGKR